MRFCSIDSRTISDSHPNRRYTNNSLTRITQRIGHSLTCYNEIENAGDRKIQKKQRNKYPSGFSYYESQPR